MRLVVDTNVVVSAFLWQGTPGRLLELAGDKQIRLFASRLLLDELADVLGRKKLVKSVQATELTVRQMLENSATCFTWRSPGIRPGIAQLPALHPLQYAQRFFLSCRASRSSPCQA